MRRLLLALVAAAGINVLASTATAQPRPDDSREEVRQLRQEIEELKATVVRLNGMIERLERRLKRLEPEPDNPFLRFPVEVERAMIPEGTSFERRSLPQGLGSPRPRIEPLPRKPER